MGADDMRHVVSGSVFPLAAALGPVATRWWFRVFGIVRRHVVLTAAMLLVGFAFRKQQRQPAARMAGLVLLAFAAGSLTTAGLMRANHVEAASNHVFEL